MPAVRVYDLVADCGNVPLVPSEEAVLASELGAHPINTRLRRRKLARRQLFMDESSSTARCSPRARRKKTRVMLRMRAPDAASGRAAARSPRWPLLAHAFFLASAARAIERAAPDVGGFDARDTYFFAIEHRLRSEPPKPWKCSVIAAPILHARARCRISISYPQALCVPHGPPARSSPVALEGSGPLPAATENPTCWNTPGGKPEPCWRFCGAPGLSPEPLFFSPGPPPRKPNGTTPKAVLKGPVFFFFFPVFFFCCR